MPRLHQIQVRYEPQEDRILLRIKTTDRAEFRFWLTRRYVKLLWPIVVKMLKADQQVQVQSSDEAKNAVLAFQREKAIEDSDFSTQFNEDTSSLPLGESPLLLARVQLNTSDAGGSILCMHPRTGKGIEMAMNETLLHSFSKLLADAARTSDWNLSLELPADLGGRTATPKRIN